MGGEEQYLLDLRSLRERGVLHRLQEMALLADDYRSGQPFDAARLVLVPRSSGPPSKAVVCGGGHAGLSTYVKLRHSKGGKTVETMALLRLNPWLADAQEVDVSRNLLDLMVDLHGEDEVL